jgi:hypothetical protein
MKSEIYLAVIERLKATELDIKHYSLWNEELVYAPEQQAFRFPAVFIEFEPTDWQQGTMKTTTAAQRIRLHILTAFKGQPDDGSPYQEQALQHLVLTENVARAMRGLTGQDFNTVMHVQSITDHNHKKILHTQEVFTTQIKLNTPLIHITTPAQPPPT